MTATTATTTSRESAMLTDVTLSQIPELSELADDDDDANLLEDDSEFDLLRRDCELGHATSFASEHSPRPRKSSTRGIFKARTNKSPNHATVSTKLRRSSTAKSPKKTTLDTTDSPSKRMRTTMRQSELDNNVPSQHTGSVRTTRRTRSQTAIEPVDVPTCGPVKQDTHSFANTDSVHTKRDLDTRIQSTKPPSTRQTETHIPRMRVGALGADTNTKDGDGQRKIGDDGSVTGKLSQRLPTFPKSIFPTKSTITEEPPSIHRSKTPTPEVTSLPTSGFGDGISSVHGRNTPTPEATDLNTSEPDETEIPPEPAPTHIPIQTHPDASSPSPPPEQPPQVLDDNVEDDEGEELEVADITLSIADADSDSDSPTSKRADNMNVEPSSVLTRYPEREHVFSPMRPGTKRSIDGNEGAADGKNWEEEGEDDKKVQEPTDMGDSDAEVETGLHMGVDLAVERRSGRLEKNGETEGGRAHMAQGTHEAKNGKSDRPQKKGRTPKSTSVQTLPAKRTKYIPRPASTSATTISNTTTSTSTMTTTKMAGDRTGTGGKTVGAPHLTQLREAHRRLGITKSERVVESSASGSSTGRTTGRRVGVRPSSRSVSASLLQRRTQPVVGDEEIGTSRAGPSVPTKQREREPWVGVRTVDTTDSKMGGTRSAATAVHLTKPVPFTFRVDARVRRVVTDPCVSGSGLNGGSGGGGIHTGEKDKGKKRDDGLKKLKLLESDHGESWMHRQKERVPSSSRVLLDGATTKPTTSINTATITTTTTTTATTVPHPFTFTTTLRATERAKFDALIRQKQEEMARVREEARKRAEEEMEREMREMRRRAVPKAHEVPEWYKEMPKRGGDGMGGG